MLISPAGCADVPLYAAAVVRHCCDGTRCLHGTVFAISTPSVAVAALRHVVAPPSSVWWNSTIGGSFSCCISSANAGTLAHPVSSVVPLFHELHGTTRSGSAAAAAAALGGGGRAAAAAAVAPLSHSGASIIIVWGAVQHRRKAAWIMNLLYAARAPRSACTTY